MPIFDTAASSSPFAYFSHHLHLFSFTTSGGYDERRKLIFNSDGDGDGDGNGDGDDDDDCDGDGDGDCDCDCDCGNNCILREKIVKKLMLHWHLISSTNSTDRSV